MNFCKEKNILYYLWNNLPLRHQISCVQRRSYLVALRSQDVIKISRNLRDLSKKIIELHWINHKDPSVLAPHLTLIAYLHVSSHVFSSPTHNSASEKYSRLLQTPNRLVLQPPVLWLAARESSFISSSDLPSIFGFSYLYFIVFILEFSIGYLVVGTSNSLTVRNIVICIDFELVYPGSIVIQIHWFWSLINEFVLDIKYINDWLRIIES
jgi:hypothetical protein